jgi:DNA polymerase-3 subunit alpha
MLFGKDFVEYNKYMVQGLFVYVRAKVQERYNQPGSLEIKINKIELLNDVKTTAFNSIRLKVSLEEVNENLIGKLDRLINENAGKSNLEFFIEDEVNKQKVKLFSKKNKVEINDNFLLELDKLITINYDLT